jgi:hypothetical protein
MNAKSILFFILWAPIVGAQTIVSTAPENAKVILEEFTGIYCVYCPQGHAIAQNIQNQNPGNVFLINIHTGGYANPQGNDPDFRTQWGAAIANQSQLIGYPAGTVNRHYFPGTAQNGGTGTAQSRGTWAATSNETLGLPSYLNMATEASVDVSTGEMTVLVEAYYTGSSPEPSNFLNVALLQNNTLGPQTGGNAGNEYNHMHRLVDMLTGQWGEEITQTSAGDFVSRTYTYQIPADYNGVPVEYADLELVVFMTETTQEIISGNGAYPTFTGLVHQNDVFVRAIDDISEQCYGELSPIVNIQNVGTDTLTSVDLVYSINDLTYEYTWTGSLSSLESTSVELPIAPFVFSGTNTVTVTAADDENNSNNTQTTTFADAQEYSGDLTLTITTDSWGSEVTWDVRDYSGTMVASGGPYGNNSTYTETISLPSESCYTFNIYDSYGDGLLSGGVSLVDDQGTVIWQSNGDYGSGASKTFGFQVVTLGTNDVQTIGAVIYPNPAQNIVNIVGADQASIAVYDLLGRNVWTQAQASNQVQMDVTSLAAGTYFVRLTKGNQVQTEKLVINR